MDAAKFMTMRTAAEQKHISDLMNKERDETKVDCCPREIMRLRKFLCESNKKKLNFRRVES